VTETAEKRDAREDSGDSDETGHGTETVEINLGLCRYGDTEEDATKMAVRKDGTGWIAVCDDHVDQAEQDGFEVRDSD